MNLINKLSYLRNKNFASYKISELLNTRIVEDFLDPKTKQDVEVRFNLFDSEYREHDIDFMHDLLLLIYKILGEFNNAKEIRQEYIYSLEKINAIRIDMTDDNLPHSTLAYDFDELKKNHENYVNNTVKEINHKLAKNSNLFNARKQFNLPTEEVLAEHTRLEQERARIQVSKITNSTNTPANNILVPSFAHSFHYNDNLAQAILMFVHEIIHAITRTMNNVGIWFATNGVYEHGIWEDLNEGLTEYLAEKICSKLFKEHSIKRAASCKDLKINRMYVLRVDLIKDLLKIFPEGMIEELFLSNRHKEIIYIFKHTFNENNVSLYDLLNSYPKGSCVIGSNEDKQSINTKNNLSQKLKNFKYCSVEKEQ